MTLVAVKLQDVIYLELSYKAMFVDALIGPVNSSKKKVIAIVLKREKGKIRLIWHHLHSCVHADYSDWKTRLF